MKNSIKLTFVLVVSFALFYAACKKLNTAAPTSKIASEKTVSGLIIASLTKSLAGSYGGVNIKDGIKQPARIVFKQNGLVINSTNQLCGYTVDTTVNYNTNIGDTIKTDVTGKFNFTFTCSNNTPNGYIVNTDLLNKGFTPDYSFTYEVAQMFTVQSFTYQYLYASLDGTLKSFGDFKYKRGPYVGSNFHGNPIFEHDKYVLSGLVIDLTHNADIVSGTTTFTTTGRNEDGTWEFAGTIVFWPNHKAKITINGKEYNADLTTGVITPV